MPDWCSNVLTVSGPVKAVRRFRREARGRSPWLASLGRKGAKAQPLCFHSLLPIPPDVLAAGYDPAGHCWEMEHWGCQWGACRSQVYITEDKMLIYEFDTVEGTPVKFIQAVSAEWPWLVFHLGFASTRRGVHGRLRFRKGREEAG